MHSIRPSALCSTYVQITYFSYWRVSACVSGDSAAGQDNRLIETIVSPGVGVSQIESKCD